MGDGAFEVSSSSAAAFEKVKKILVTGKKNEKTASGGVSKAAALSLQLDHLYRFAGIVGGTLDAETMLNDALEPIVSLALADKALLQIAPSPPEAKDMSVSIQRGWASPAPLMDAQDVAELDGETKAFDKCGSLPAALRAVVPDVAGPAALVPLQAHGRRLGYLLLVRKDGAPRFDANTRKMLSTAGRQLALATENARLFSDLEASYSRLMNAQEELIRSESLAALGGLAATMAHEIRNPLATIFSSLSQIRKHANISGDSATLLEIAEEEALRLNRMVAGLLEFARPRTPRPECVYPFALVRDLIDRVIAKGEVPGGAHIELKANEEDFEAEVDPELFSRAVGHVLSNALAALPRQDGRVEVEVIYETDPHTSLIVKVSDNGAGIPAQYRDKVFDPFFSSKPSGIGLGLSVVRRIVEDHRGRVDIDSEPGRGTTACLLFLHS